MGRYLRWLWIPILMLGLSGCFGGGGGGSSSAITDVETVGAGSGEDQDIAKYKIFPGDRVQLSIYEEPSLATTTTVENDGTAIFPLIGPVKIGGLTVPEATQKIEKAYSDGYLIDPVATLSVVEHAKRTYTVFGEVKSTGTHQIPSGKRLTLLEAIGRAGGYTSKAKPSHVTVKREVNGQTKIFHLNARKMARNSNSQQFYIQPNDVIRVAEGIW